MAVREGPPKNERYQDLISNIESLLDKNDYKKLMEELAEARIKISGFSHDDFLSERKAYLESLKETLERYKKRYQALPEKLADITFYQEELLSYIALIEKVRLHYRHEQARVTLEGSVFKEKSIKEPIEGMADEDAIKYLKNLESELNTILTGLKLREEALKAKVFVLRRPFYSDPEIEEMRRLKNMAKTYLMNCENIRAPYEMAKSKRKQEAQLNERLQEREANKLRMQDWHFKSDNVWGQAALNFWNGLWVDYVTPEEANALHRKQEDLDRLFKEGVLEGDKVTLRYAADSVKDLAIDIVTAIKDFTKDTVTSALDVVTLFFAAPFIVPMKLTNVIAKGTERALWAVGFSAQAFREWGIKLGSDFLNKPSLGKGLMMLPALVATVAGGVTEFVSKMGATVAKGIRNVFDYDKWSKKAPILRWGFVALGTTLFIAASIGTLGIFPAVVGTGLAVAAGVSAAYSAVYAFFKAWEFKRPKKSDLNTLKLSDAEELQLGLQDQMRSKKRSAVQAPVVQAPLPTQGPTLAQAPTPAQAPIPAQVQTQMQRSADAAFPESSPAASMRTIREQLSDVKRQSEAGLEARLSGQERTFTPKSSEEKKKKEKTKATEITKPKMKKD